MTSKKQSNSNNSLAPRLHDVMMLGKMIEQHKE